jgi:phage shock protein PspC (stress-responsive transcriptional regulator)
MSLADELIKLEQLRERGTLNAEEFDRAKASLLNLDPVPVVPSDLAQAINRLRRSGSDRWISGVCGGLTVATGVESWVWRLLMVALAFAGGLGVAIYALLWIFVPADSARRATGT